MDELRFRQIHLDFHTSEKIPSVAECFDAEEFAQTLEDAHVNSITCFARGHHGMLYYDSKRFPELVHPTLKNKNLLRDQIDACHKHGIRVPIYTTVQWDDHMSRLHPEWCCITEDGKLLNLNTRDGNSIFDPGFYRTLCVNNPGYRKFLKEQVADIFECLSADRVDGLFFDIVSARDCCCPHCVKGMQERGYNPTEKADRIRYANEMLKEFRLDMTDYVHTFKDDLSIFYNGGHIGTNAVAAREAFTHWELESLPSGQWGYSHFVNTIRFARTTGMDCLSHTGKFHTEWGDFHSFKNPEALQYECFRMLAYNCKCLIGDQLTPDGAMSKPVYDLIGSVYQEVEKKEPWCIGATAVVDLAILTDEWQNVGNGKTVDSVSKAVSGACTMLDEMGYQFDIVDNQVDWSKYRVLILPDMIWVDETLQKKLEAYTAGGGKLLLTGKSGLDQSRTKFMVDLGAKYVGEAPYCPDFIMPNDVMGKNLPKTEHVMYLKGEQVEAVDGEVLADAYIPYFNRTWEHFCSHLHTPSCRKKGYPAVVRKGNTIYLMHPVFSIYQKNHPKWCREWLRDALELLLPEPVLRHDGPTLLTTTVNEQAVQRRYVMHALNYIPVKNCDDIYTIEDIIPLYSTTFSLKLEKPILSVRIVPDGREIPFEVKNGRISFTVDRIDGHLMVALQYI